MTRRGEHIVLIGTMGAGKTVIGTELARTLSRPFLDNDLALLAATGKTAAELLEERGVDELHKAELEALSQQMSAKMPSVIVAAASTIDTEAGRQLLHDAGQVVFLRADPATLVARVKGGPTRPVPGAIESVIPELDAKRRPLFESVADAVVDVDQANDPMRSVLRNLQRVVQVPLGDRSYNVVVGPGASQFLSENLPSRAKRAAVITQESIPYEVETGIETHVFYVPDGESAKSLTTVEELCRAMSRAGITRNDVVVGVGGGVVTDLAGFVAAVYHRGMDVVHVSTTLLGQVDAAIGGKTGVNLPEGKNLVGAFWQPAAVFCDTDMLATLPEREQRSGHGEMAKYAFLGVEDLDELPISEQVARCVAAKAAVVGADEREGDARMTLNYGHTLAHALEAAGFADGPGRDGIDLRHGEAVAIGLVFAAQLANVLGRIDERRVARHLDIVHAYGLPDAIPAAADFDELVVLMGRDKKATAGITFMLDGPSGVQAVKNVSEDAMREAFARASVSSSAIA